MFLDPMLRVISELVDQADRSEADEVAAKAQLLDYLASHPDSADAWFLVSQLADNVDDKLLALDRCLTINPAHYEGQRVRDALQPTATQESALTTSSPTSEALAQEPVFDFTDEPVQEAKPQQKTDAKLAKQPAQASKPETSSAKSRLSSPSRPKSQKSTPESRAAARRAEAQSTSKQPATLQVDAPLGPIHGKTIDSTLLNAAAFHFVQQGWSAVDVQPRVVRLEKTFGIAWLWAILAAALIPGAGFVVLMGNLFARRTKRLKLESIPSGDRISISGIGRNRIWITPEHVRLNQIPMPHVSFMESMVWGLVLTVIIVVGLAALVYFLGSEITEEETFSPGHSVIIQSRSNATCAPLYDTPSRFGERSINLPSGLEVTVLSVQKNENNDTTWYQIRGNNGVVGWIVDDYVDDQQADLNGSFEACN